MKQTLKKSRFSLWQYYVILNLVCRKKNQTKAVATAEAVQMIRDALPDKPVSDITSTDLANAVAFYMGQTTDLNDEGLAMVQNLAKYICDNSVSEKKFRE